MSNMKKIKRAASCLNNVEWHHCKRKAGMLPCESFSSLIRNFHTANNLGLKLEMVTHFTGTLYVA